MSNLNGARNRNCSHYLPVSDLHFVVLGSSGVRRRGMAPARVAQPTQGTHFPCLSDRRLSYLGRPRRRRRLGSPSTGELVFHICTQITLS